MVVSGCFGLGMRRFSLWFVRGCCGARRTHHAAVKNPSERILVIFGAGHLAWLRRDFDSDPTIELRKLSDFIK